MVMIPQRMAMHRQINCVCKLGEKVVANESLLQKDQFNSVKDRLAIEAAMQGVARA